MIHGTPRHHLQFPSAERYDETGTKVTARYWQALVDGKWVLHRNNGPAKITYDENGNVRKKVFLIYGVPASVRNRESPTLAIYENGMIERAVWLDEQKRIHREDGPAVVHFRTTEPDTGSVSMERWFTHGTARSGELFTAKKYLFETRVRDRNVVPEPIVTTEWRDTDGRLHRDGDEPALIKIDNTGEVVERQWYIHGQLSRVNPEDPPVHTVSKHRQWKLSAWYNADIEYHRPNGLPAIEQWWDDGNHQQVFMEHGVQISKLHEDHPDVLLLTHLSSELNPRDPVRHKALEKIWGEWGEHSVARHRIGQPARIVYQLDDDNVQTINEALESSAMTLRIHEYYLRGELWRRNGPARVWFYPNGKKKELKHFLGGTPVQKDFYEKRKVQQRPRYYDAILALQKQANVPPDVARNVVGFLQGGADTAALGYILS